MGKDSERTAASSGESEDSDGLGSSKAHHVGLSPQEDRRRSKGALGEGEGGEEESGIGLRTWDEKMIPPTYKPKRKFMQLAIAGAKRARERGGYPIGAVIARVIGKQEAVIGPLATGQRPRVHPSSMCSISASLISWL
jgi:hypothetical protein